MAIVLLVKLVKCHALLVLRPQYKKTEYHIICLTFSINSDVNIPLAE